MQKINKTQLIKEVKDEEVNAVEIIRSNEEPNKCSVIICDDMFSCPYEAEFNFELIQTIKENAHKDLTVIMFVDNELNEAWKQSYLEGGIEENRHDRRVEFHKYNDMNEMFCLDEFLLGQIKGNYRGMTDDDLPAWKVGIIKWYRNHLI